MPFIVLAICQILYKTEQARQQSYCGNTDLNNYMTLHLYAQQLNGQE
jgi:hypothetical protein